MSDLFTWADGVASTGSSCVPDTPLDPSGLDDDALVARLSDGGLRTAPALAAEAGRRRLGAAVPALESLCRGLTGYGSDCFVPEQHAALGALRAIGGAAARQAVARLIAAQAFLGPTLASAMALAGELEANLPIGAARLLMDHPDPAIRANACRCAPGGPEAASLLRDRLDDRAPAVRHAAACSLGRRGRPEALPLLRRLLETAPDPDVIEAAGPIADHDSVVLLGRIARTMPALRDAALAALSSSDDPAARKLMESVSRAREG